MKLRMFVLVLALIAMPFALTACGTAEEPVDETMMEEQAAEEGMEEAAEEEAMEEEAMEEEAVEEEAMEEEAVEEEGAGAEEVLVMTVADILADPQDGLMVNLSGTITAVTEDGKLELTDDTGTILLELPEGTEIPLVDDEVGVFGSIDAAGDVVEIDVIEVMMLEASEEMEEEGAMAEEEMVDEGEGETEGEVEEQDEGTMEESEGEEGEEAAEDEG